MTTTLNRIRRHSPCTEGWTKLLKHLGKTTADDEPLSLLTILTSNGLADAIWCLRAEPTPERTQRFALAIARRVEHLHPAAKACNDTTERYLNGTATKAELDAAAAVAAAVAAYASRAVAAARAATFASRSVAAARAANAATFTSNAATYAANAAANADNADNAAAYAANAAANAAAYAAEREAQAQIFKEIFA